MDFQKTSGKSNMQTVIVDNFLKWVYYYNEKGSSPYLEFEAINKLLLTYSDLPSGIRTKSFVFWKHLRKEKCLSQPI